MLGAGLGLSIPRLSIRDSLEAIIVIHRPTALLLPAQDPANYLTSLVYRTINAVSGRSNFTTIFCIESTLVPDDAVVLLSCQLNPLHYEHFQIK